MRSVLLCLCLFVSGCASTFELDKTTVVIFSLGPTFAIVRTLEAEAQAKGDAREP